MKRLIQALLLALVALLLMGFFTLRFYQMNRPVEHIIGGADAPTEITLEASPRPEAAVTPLPTASPTPTPEPTATPAPTVDPATPYGMALKNAADQGLPEPPDVDVSSWELILVNASHPLDQNYEPETAEATASRCPQDARIKDALEAFAGGCEEAGLPVFCGSGYRPYYIQYNNFQAKVAEYGYATAATIVAPPGTSEHQTGLCCDITDWMRDPLIPEVLSQTETFRWLNEHCAEYGFILRYPEGKQNVTGIIYEPWHFRYVGKEAAAYIQANGLCLEEFLALYGVE